MEQIAEKGRKEEKEKDTKGIKEEKGMGKRRKHGTKHAKNEEAQYKNSTSEI